MKSLDMFAPVAAPKTSKAEGRDDVAQVPTPSLTPVRDMPAWQAGDSSASPPNGPFGIYRLTREWSTYAWLCDRHVGTKRRAAAG